MVTLTEAPKNWEILQQRDGYATFSVRGEYDPAGGADAVIYVGVLNETDSFPVIDWVTAEKDAGTFSATLTVPAGGLYRLEVRHTAEERIPPLEAGQCAARHHFGVGDNYLIAGQSNASGVGKGYIEETPDLLVHVLRDRTAWDLATHPLDILLDRHNPWLSFGKTLARGVGYPIGLIPTAVAGSQMRRWLPEEEGDLYREMRRVVTEQGIQVRGVLWYQGCAEAMDTLGDSYGKQLSSFISHLRADFRDQALPVFLVQVNRHIDGRQSPEIHRSWAQVREAQRQAARTVPGVYITSAFDSAMSDGIHNAAITDPALGQRVARLALYHLYGRGTPCDAPDLEEAALTAPDRVSLRFSHLHTMVTYGLHGDRFPMILEDGAGQIPVIACRSNRDTVELELARPTSGKVYVSGMYGSEHPYYLVDGSTQIPMLGFYHVEVKELPARKP